VPGFAYLHLRFLEAGGKLKKYNHLLEEYLDKFPEYPPFRYLHVQRLLSLDTFEEGIKKSESLLSIKEVWPGRSKFCEEQTLLHIQLLYTLYATTFQFHYVDELLEYYEDDYPDLIPGSMKTTSEVLKIPYVLKWIEEQNE